MRMLVYCLLECILKLELNHSDNDMITILQRKIRHCVGLVPSLGLEHGFVHVHGLTESWMVPEDAQSIAKTTHNS